MRAAVLGGSGFIGSHLVDRLLALGQDVVVVDDFSTGRRSNLAHLAGNARVQILEWDICKPIPVVGPLTTVWNFASPASPIDYARRPIETLEVGSLGVKNACELAERAGATLVHASTSEVYGDPLVHPQREDYFGNVNPIGPRACYDESKRFAEAYITSFARARGLPCQLGRIFNTYGPRMREEDGRVIPAFACQALDGKDFTVFGDGSQTRSFTYVDDLLDGFLLLRAKGDGQPVNLGNPNEMTLVQLADIIRQVAGSGGKVVSVRPLPENDPKQRKPDIARAQSLLGWQPKVPLHEGLKPTLEWYRKHRAK
ncbi:MAG: NAD-dependent epimerase/dehydratase family protein [Deltaproteobacteria bacterium]|nr:NAD-dependent epimerase/dehydratase family protein [Deltaproteobacteria bacterium]